MNQGSPFKIDFKSIVLVEEQFKREPFISENLKLDISFNINNSVTVENPSICQVELSTNMKIIDNENDALYATIFLKHIGVFEIDSDNEQKEIFVKYNLPPMMFPYIREHITSITLKAGFQPIILPPLNIIAMLEQEHKNEGEQPVLPEN